MSQSKIQIPIKSGFILFGLFNLVIIGAGHGIATIGIMLFVVFWVDLPFDTNMFLLLLGWPATLLLFFEMIYAKLKNKKLRSTLFFIISLLFTLSIFGLIGISEASVISFISAIPFFIGVYVHLIRNQVRHNKRFKSDSGSGSAF
ncbi:MAG: hypothetical protein ACMZ7B_04700 [Balneola sp.]